MDKGRTSVQNPPDVVAIGVMVAFLRLGKPVDHASSFLLFGTFLLQMNATSPLAVAVLSVAFLAALVEKYYAWRVALDVDLFALLQQFPEEGAGFDAALAACIGHQGAMPSRSLTSRWTGARRLLKCQIAAFGLQVTCLAGAFLHSLVHHWL